MVDVAAAVERNHKRRYEDALAVSDVADTAPKWEELTEEQRQNIRNINDEHDKWFNDLGAALASGGPLPDLP